MLPEPIRKPLSNVKTKLINRFLSYYGPRQAKNYNISDTIVVTGSPRSGTTWLGELMSTVPGYRMLYEPLDMNRHAESRAMGLGWRPYIAPGTDWPEAEAFLYRILTGQLLNRSTTTHLSMAQILTRKGWVIKFVRASAILKWMTERFPLRTPLLLIRHPCAVVASQTRSGRQTVSIPMKITPSFAAAFPELADYMGTLKTQEEARAARYCMHYYPPLSLPKPHPWHLVTYERLVRQGRQELEQIFEALEMEMPAEAIKHLRIPSATTKDWSNVRAGKDPLAGWTKNLSKEQIKQILAVTSTFGLDFYGEDLEPDYDRLYGC